MAHHSTKWSPERGQVQHFGQAELQQLLDDHNKSLAGRGVSCQCMDCLYRRWYWKMQYGVVYPNLAEWAQKKEA